MIPDDFVQMAQAYRLLSELDSRQLRKLLPLAQDQQFEAGRIIFKEGDKSSFLHLIVSGEVALEMVIDGQVVRVQTLQPGDAMGWSAIIADSLTHFQARALSLVSTVAFPSHKIREACDLDPELGYALMRRLLGLVTERLDATRTQLGHVHLESVPGQRG